MSQDSPDTGQATPDTGGEDQTPAHVERPRILLFYDYA